MNRAIGPWRDRKHLGEPNEGPPGIIRDWPGFTVVIFTDERGVVSDPARVAIIGPTSGGRPSHLERYTVRLPANGEARLKARLVQALDARQLALDERPFRVDRPKWGGPGCWCDHCRYA